MPDRPIIVVALGVIVIAYAVIVAASRHSLQELAWTVVPALLLVLLILVTAQITGAAPTSWPGR